MSVFSSPATAAVATSKEKRIVFMALRVRGERLRRDRCAVIALGVVAILDVPLALGLLFEEVGRLALRAGAGCRPVVEGEVALRVARAGEEDAVVGAALDELPFLALRTLHSRRLRRGGLSAADLAD